jgi:hypothetical protein
MRPCASCIPFTSGVSATIRIISRLIVDMSQSPAVSRSRGWNFPTVAGSKRERD